MKLETSISSRCAFSIIEILVVVTLLSVIIVGLMLMFSQTQKALLGSTTQVEVLELGRATVDLLARDLEQLSPSYSPDPNAPNFFAFHEPLNPLQAWTQTNIPPLANLAVFQPAMPPFQKYLQPLPANNEYRTNVMERLFFVTRYNQQWDAIGYRIVQTVPGVGTLYRTNFSNTGVTNLALDAWNFYNLTDQQVTNGMNRIADGVVHLRVQAFDTNGVLINFPRSANLLSSAPPFGSGDCNYAFLSNAVPASLELELGFLETRTLDRLKGFPPAAAATYLSNHVAQVHVFRLRPSVRNVDPTAYQ